MKMVGNEWVSKMSDPQVASDSYELIYADPPWRYESGTTRPSNAIENQYPTMSLEDIKDLDVPAADDCILYMWATAPKLSEAIEVVEAWDFDYRTSAVWDKKRLGLGHWFRVEHELLLVGVRGDASPPDTDNRRGSIFQEERREHSRKPDVVRRHIMEAHPDKSKIELFARDGFVGWDVWGNESPETLQQTLGVVTDGGVSNE